MSEQHLENDNMVLLVGQLMATAKITSEAIQKLGDESKTTTASLVRAAAALETLNTNVTGLMHLVRDGNGESLVNQMNRLNNKIESLERQVSNLGPKVESMRENWLSLTGLKVVFLITMQLLTVGAAVWALFKR